MIAVLHAGSRQIYRYGDGIRFDWIPNTVNWHKILVSSRFLMLEIGSEAVPIEFSKLNFYFRQLCVFIYNNAVRYIISNFILKFTMKHFMHVMVLYNVNKSEIPPSCKIQN